MNVVNSTLSAGLEVLETLWTKKGPLGVTELARGLGRDKANVHRVLVTLVAHGFVHQDGDSRKYRLGPAWSHRFETAMRRPPPPPGRRTDAAAAWLTGTGNVHRNRDPGFARTGSTV